MFAIDKANHDEFKTDHDAVLQHASVPSMGNVYIIGYGAKQVTIYAQQGRALKLLWAIDRKLQLRGKRVAIIGGGIAGVTAASAALVFQANVTVLERNEELLHLQRGCHNRYLHPAIYEWPERTARRASAIYLSSIGPSARQATSQHRFSRTIAESKRARVLIISAPKSRTRGMCRSILLAPQSLGAGIREANRSILIF